MEYHTDLIQFCKDEIIIENPYIISEKWWHTLHHVKSEQNQKMQIITSLKDSDHPAVIPTFNANAHKPCSRGVRFYDYTECGVFSHWKIAVDCNAKTVFHGSSNLNTRSATHDFEVDILVKSPQIFDKVKEILEYDIASGRLIKNTELSKSHGIDKGSFQFTSYFS